VRAQGFYGRAVFFDLTETTGDGTWIRVGLLSRREAAVVVIGMLAKIYSPIVERKSSKVADGIRVEFGNLPSAAGRGSANFISC
jgi:hypothetical protein